MINLEEHPHPDLVPTCQRRIEDEEYDRAIQAAGKALDEALGDKASDSLVAGTDSAADLASSCFNSSNPDFNWVYSPGEQKGIIFLYRGAIQALRNPASHRRCIPQKNRYLDDVGRSDAIDAVCTFNFLLKKLDDYHGVELEHEPE